MARNHFQFKVETDTVALTVSPRGHTAISMVIQGKDGRRFMHWLNNQNATRFGRPNPVHLDMEQMAYIEGQIIKDGFVKVSKRSFRPDESGRTVTLPDGEIVPLMKSWTDSRLYFRQNRKAERERQERNAAAIEAARMAAAAKLERKRAPMFSFPEYDVNPTQDAGYEAIPF